MFCFSTQDQDASMAGFFERAFFLACRQSPSWSIFTEWGGQKALVSLPFLACVCAQSFSHIWLFVAPWTVAHWAPLSMGFLRQEYWSDLPWPPPGDLPNGGTKLMFPASPALIGGFFTTESPRKCFLLRAIILSWGPNPHDSSNYLPKTYLQIPSHFGLGLQ